MNKPRFRQINIADISDAAIDSINDSLHVPKLLRAPPTQVMPVRHGTVAPSRRQAVDAPPKVAPIATERHKLTMRIPQSLNDAMKRDALDLRTHVSTIIFSALLAAGYPMPANDALAPDATARLRLAILSRQPSAEPPSRQQQGPSTQQKLTINAAASLGEALKREALVNRTTIRAVVLRALKDLGYTVAEADMAPGAGGNC